MDGQGAVLAAIGGFILIFIIIGIAAYVLMSMGLYKLATNASIENPWLAWIPIANMYIIGKLIRSLKIGDWEIPQIEVVLPIATVVVGVISGIPVIGQLVAIANAVLFFFALHKLYKIYRPEQSTTWLVLSIILPFLTPIFIFIIRDNKPAM